VKGALGDALNSQPPRLSEAEGGFSLEQISEERPVCGYLVVRIKRIEHVMLYEYDTAIISDI
jgi:hypothetical protein